MAEKNVIFNQVGTSNLYEANGDSETNGWLGLALPADVSPPEKTITLAKALSDKDLNGSFIFAVQVPDISTTEKIKAFLDAIAGIITASPASRGIIWLRDINSILPDNSPIMPISATGSRLVASLDVPLIKGMLSVQVISGAPLTLNGTNAILKIGDGSANVVTFSGPSKPLTRDPVTAELPFTGNNRGCLQYDVSIERDSLNKDLNWGFQYLYPSTNSVFNESAQWYPFASGQDPSPTDIIQFNAVIDPADVLNQSNEKTVFTFTGKNSNGKQTLLNSWYRTNFGHTIQLLPPGESFNAANYRPAGLKITQGTLTPDEIQDFHFTPVGDFIMKTEDSASNQTQYLMCGLSGTETLRFQPVPNGSNFTNGDRLRFIPGKPAYAPLFPFKKVAMSDPVTEEELLNATFTTAWVTIVPGNGERILYSAQPEDGVLYSKQGGLKVEAASHAEMLPPFFPTVGLPENDCFPLPPYAGIYNRESTDIDFSADKVIDFEFQIINPTRKKQITGESPVAVPTVGQTGEITATNTQGMIVTVEQNGTWENVLFAKNNDQSLMFSQFGAKLQNAFQSNQQFIVISNNTNIGQFDHAIGIEGWPFEINVPKETNYGDYRNIVIFKFCNGPLKDLINNPSTWTQAGDFTSSSQLNTLSQWLQQYIAEAENLRTHNPMFQKFIDIVTTPGWNGVLVLKADIKLEEMPLELQGLLGGMDPDKFYAHHIGIEMNKVAVDDSGKIVLKEDSSLFGLISYMDDVYKEQLEAGEDPDTPVPPPPDCIYDFKVLTLQVLFENSRIKEFRSKAQLTINQLFSDKVIKTVTGKQTMYSNSIVFNGSCQRHGSGSGDEGSPVYAFDTTALTRLYFDSNILPHVDIQKAQFNTVQNQDKKSTKVLCRFLLWGKMGFEKLVCKSGLILNGEKGDFAMRANTRLRPYKELPDNRRGEPRVHPTFPDTLKLKEQEQTKQETATDFDIFSFGGENGAEPGDNAVGLAFSNLFIGMDFDINTPTVKTFTFNTDEGAFDPGQSDYHPTGQNLYRNFALQLNRFVCGTADQQPRDLGYLEVRMPDLAGGGVSGDWYGLECSLNMGTPGELAAAAGFYSTLLIAWSPGSKSNDQRYNAYVGIKLPGTEGAKLFGIQGVLKIGIAGIQLFYAETDQSFLLKLNDIALKFLGLLKIPPGSTTSFYLFGAPEGKKEALGWYAAYNKDEKN